MEFKEYQLTAACTAKEQGTIEGNKQIAFLGIAGESGELISEYKKFVRDGSSRVNFRHRVKEELGDLLWYLSRIADLHDLSLEDIAHDNLVKISDRWQIYSGDAADQSPPIPFDADFPQEEQLPRQVKVVFREASEDGRSVMTMYVNGEQVGNDITDNSHVEDGYRYHDVFHWAFAIVLGWSPVMRQLLKVKRKSDPKIDEIEDGGRAKAIEEGISTMIFTFAEDQNYFEGVNVVDKELLVTLRKMTAGLEVGRCPLHLWESVILQSFVIWRQLIENKGGCLNGDFNTRTINYTFA